MKTRVISGIVIALVLAGVLIPGGYLLAAVLTIVSFISYFELTRATGVHEDNKKVNALEACGYASIIVHYVQMILVKSHKYFVFSILFAFFLIMVCYVLSFPKFKSVQAVAAFFCFVYAPVSMSFVYLLRMRPYGQYFAWIPFIAWVCDTCAYFAGRAFGKHKLAPVLSPKKTIEGSIGGILGSVIVGAIFGYVLYVNATHDKAVIFVLVIITFVGSIIAQLGDLLASGIKRDHEIKDYGKIIPGHGGIMDRFDSVIFVIPCVYFLAAVLFPLMK
ncbi:phosphatidate cytidylyltransferase [Butyrivibrio hungatei DSM 14810]|uniref:Phosphatidate cytidylyltransferase n=1 Tax=Butyrivibrio hungatei DSM 14810 TaxID=1121132 RepID=A0A1M7S3S7_9FIRM|nr:phosphatidate cytidylyltransferase [Butyrivibrio hungatei]SHN53071.1 phosphatidate cytidylyltransferase [Butyrivibrio hungatei DSM 14810]